MQVWRLAKAARPTFDGEGARLYGGRWNHLGVPVVYTSNSLSLAVLEYFVHLDIDLAPTLVAIPADIPDTIGVLHVGASALPPDWRHTPAPAALANLGSTWARERATAVLAVPSVLVPTETNYILNPAHPDFGRIIVGAPVTFSLDPRMLKTSSRRTRRRAGRPSPVHRKKR